MVYCSCGKPIEKIPSWMQGIQVEFVCTNCPNRQTKNIAFVNLESVLNPSVKTDEPVLDDEEEEAAEDA